MTSFLKEWIIRPSTMSAAASRDFAQMLSALRCWTDKLFVLLLIGQAIFAIGCATVLSPLTWKADQSSIHPHVWAAVFASVLLTGFPIYCVLRHPGRSLNRWGITVSQFLYSSLIIHLLGGRIEAHFHVFGSLAILAFYRDWRLFVPAILIVLFDHLFRAAFYPQSIFGVEDASVWRAFEHAGWVVFETIFLIIGIHQSLRHLHDLAESQASLEAEKSELQHRVREQTTELRNSCELMSAVLDGTETHVMLVDDSGNITMANRQSKDFAENEVHCEMPSCYFTLLEQFGLGDQQTAVVRDSLSKLRTEQRGKFSHELTFRTASEIKTFVVTMTYDAFSQSAVVSHADITQKVRALKLLREKSEESELLSLVARYTDNSVIVTDRDAKIEWVNDGFTRMTGYEIDEVVGQNPGRILRGSGTDSDTIAKMRLGIQTEKGFDVEVLNYHKSGRSFWSQIEARPIVGEQGKVERYIAITSDVTERRKASDNLKQQTEHARELADALRASHELVNMATTGAGIATWVWDIPSGKVQWGQLWENLLGMQDGETVGDFDDLVERIHEDDRERTEAALQNHLDLAANEFNIDYRLRTDDRGYVWCNVSGTIVDRTPDGLPAVMAGVTVDISEARKNAEQASRSQKLESIGQLAAGIAHEINTPMQCIAGNIEFLTEQIDGLFEDLESLVEPADGGQAGAIVTSPQEMIEQSLMIRQDTTEALDETSDASNRIIEIVRAMKGMSHPGQSSTSDHSVNQVIRDAVTISRNRWKGHCAMQLQLDSDEPRAELYAAEMSQVVLNLVVNAADAIADRQSRSPDHAGEIRVETCVHDDTLALRVSDNGCGIPEEVRARVFDPFFTTKEVGKGTGQGLSIAHDVVVHKHHGTIRIDSEPNQGSTFVIELPIRQPAAV